MPEPASRPSPREVEISRLQTLGAEAQGAIDDSLLRDNLRLTVTERLQAAGRAAASVTALRAAMRKRPR